VGRARAAPVAAPPPPAMWHLVDSCCAGPAVEEERGEGRSGHGTSFSREWYTASELAKDPKYREAVTEEEKVKAYKVFWVPLPLFAQNCLPLLLCALWRPASPIAAEGERMLRLQSTACLHGQHKALHNAAASAVWGPANAHYS
jgi:hypothetical protein